MYETFFGFTDRPFLPIPQADRCHATTSLEIARQTLSRTIERGEGPGLLIGPPGTGKSLLCQVLARDFAERFAVALLTNGRLATRAALLQAILYELGLPYRGMDEGELRLALIDFLQPADVDHDGLLLIVDEAQSMPLKLLEEIRLITNLSRDGQPRVRVVLAGNAQLEERFASPRLSIFAQRLAARCYLDALNAEETRNYVQAEIRSVGGDADRLFDDGALRSIYRASDGIPRLINQVCDHALILASLGGATTINSDAIEEAWADLQQLPAPWSAGAAGEDQGSVIEFGQLDDAEDDNPEAIPFRKQPSEPLHLAETDDTAEATCDSGDEPEPSIYDAPPSHRQRQGTTEVELYFPEFGDPGTEHFDEEEIVLDRFPVEADLFASAPRVSSWESRQLASMLAAYEVALPEFVEGCETVEPTVELTAVSDGLPEIDPAPGHRSDVEPESFIAASVNLPTSLEEVASAEQEEPYFADDGETISSREMHASREATFWADTKAQTHERQMIIIEEQPPALAAPAA